MTLTELFFALIRCTICEKQLPEKVKTTLQEHEDAYSSLFTLSKSHDLAHLICDSLDKNDLLPENAIGEQFRSQRLNAVFRYEQLRYDFDELCETLESAEIDYMPLKGSVIRQLYPEPWLRTSCDIDVLVHKSALEKTCALLRDKLEYKDDIHDSHDYSFWSNEGVHLELHFDLIEYIPKLIPVLSHAWETSHVKGQTKHCFEMTDEMFYFYHLGHMAKHVVNGGCGIRSFIDLWILDNVVPHDREKRDALLMEGGLLTFANAARKLVAVWFDEQEKDEFSEKFEKYLLHGGSYGNLENRVTVQHVKKGGKFRYYLSLIWLPYDRLKVVYPGLEKRKWLFPFYQIRRWFRILFKGMRTTTKRHLQTSNSITKQQREDVASLLQELEL